MHLSIFSYTQKFLLYHKVDVLHVRLTELHAAHQNLPPAIRTLRLKETIQNIHQKTTDEIPRIFILESRN